MNIDEIALALTQITVQDKKFQFYNHFDNDHPNPNQDNVVKVFEVYKTMYNLLKDFHNKE